MLSQNIRSSTRFGCVVNQFLVNVISHFRNYFFKTYPYPYPYAFPFLIFNFPPVLPNSNFDNSFLRSPHGVLRQVNLGRQRGSSASAQGVGGYASKKKADPVRGNFVYPMSSGKGNVRPTPMPATRASSCLSYMSSTCQAHI